MSSFCLKYINLIKLSTGLSGGHAYPTASDLCIDVNIPTFKYNKFDIMKLPVERSYENIGIDQVNNKRTE